MLWSVILAVALYPLHALIARKMGGKHAGPQRFWCCDTVGRVGSNHVVGYFVRGFNHRVCEKSPGWTLQVPALATQSPHGLWWAENCMIYGRSA